MNLLDLKLAIRNLLKNKAFTIINITGLTLGLTACLYMALMLRHETSFDRFHPDANRLYRVQSSYTSPDRSSTQGYCDALAGPEIQQSIPGIEDVCRLSPPTTAKLLKNDKVYRSQKVRYADPNFFRFFSFDLLLGSSEEILEGPDEIVITEEMAREIFGDQNPVGQAITTSEGVDWTVKGVCRSLPKNTHIDFDILASYKTAKADPNIFLTWEGGMQFLTYLRLEPATKPETINSLFPDFLYPRVNKKLENYGWKMIFKLQPITDIHLGRQLDYDESSNRTVSYLAVISSIAILILILAIINYINLASALSRLRFKEMGMRKILGASRRGIRTQVLAESLILALLAGILAIIVLQLIYPTLNKFTGSDFSPYSEPLLYIISLLLIILITGLLSGFAPAFLMAGKDAAKSLQERIRGASKNHMRNLLVTIQFTAAVFLIICFILIQKQSGYVLKQDLGFDKDQIISLPNDRGFSFEEADRLRQEMLRMPEISSVCISSQIPGQSLTGNGYILEGKEDPEVINVIYADNEFLDCFGIDLLMGRNFRPELDNELNSFLVNEALVQYAGWDDALGKTITRNFPREVVGVFSDFNFSSLEEPIKPLILSVSPRRDGWLYYQLNIRHNSTDMPDLMNKVRTIWDRQMPGLVFDPIFLDDYIKENYAGLENQASLITMFSLVAIIVACIGLLGMSAFIAFTRRKEIGIRKVNGALLLDIVAKLNYDMLKWVLISICLAIPLSFPAMNKWLMNFAYKTNISWWIFPLAAGLALGIALMTVSWQSYRAARLDPVRTLRYE